MAEKSPIIRQAYELLSAIFNDAEHPTGDLSGMSSLQSISIYLIAKTLRTQRSVYFLWEEGLNEDMGSLIRGLYETSIIVQYLTEKGTELEADQFSAKAEIKKLEISGSLLALYPNSKTGQMLKKELPQIRKNVAFLKNEYFGDVRTADFWGRVDNWLRKRVPFLRQKRREKTLLDMAKAIGRGKEYKLVFPHLSSYLHTDSYAVTNHVRLENNVWRVYIDEPNYEKANAMAILSMSYTAQIMEHYFHIHGMNKQEDRFKKLFQILSKKE